MSNDFVWNSDELLTGPATDSLHAALGLFSPRAWAAYRANSGEGYHPVAALTFWVDSALWSGASWGCHLFNVLLHAAVCLLVYGVVRRLSDSAAVGLAAALLFAAHAAHVESVNWVKNRAQLVGVALGLSAIWLALLPQRGTWRSVWRPAGVLACLAAGLLAQEQAIGAAVVVAYVCWQGGPNRRGSRAFLAQASLGLAAGYVLLRFTALQFEEKVGIPLDHVLEDTGVEPVCATLLFYVSKAMLPLRHSVDYASGLVSSGVLFRSPWVLSGVAAGVVLALGAGRRAALAAVVWFLATVAPASNAVPIIGRPLAEQRVYFPSVAACLLVGAACVGGRERGRTRWALLGLGVLAMAALTLQRNFVWQSGRALWHYAVCAEPRHDRPRSNLALAYGEAGRRGLAKHELHQALRIEPSADTHVQLAYLARAERDFAAAEQHLLAALAIEKSADTYVNLALVYQDMKRYREALEQTRRALRLRPRMFKAMIEAGDIYVKLGQPQQAVKAYLEAAAVQPNSALPYLCVGDVERVRGNYRRAIESYQNARQLEPRNVQIRYEMAGAYRLLQLQAAQRHDVHAAALYGQRAEQVYANILRIDPMQANAMACLGEMAEGRGDVERAARLYYHALRISPNCDIALHGWQRLRGQP